MIKMNALFKKMRPIWKYAACNDYGDWKLFEVKPYYSKKEKDWLPLGGLVCEISCLFDIEPFKGDCKKSLMERKEDGEKRNSGLKN